MKTNRGVNILIGVALGAAAILGFKANANTIENRLRGVAESSHIGSFLDGGESLETFKRDFGSIIEQNALEYNVPPDALYMIAQREYLNGGNRGLFGIGPYKSDQVKQDINNLRAKRENAGDYELGRHVGVALGPYNLKAGTLTKSVIAAIKDELLKQQLLQNYDEKLGHVNQEFLASLFATENQAEDINIATELAAAYMSAWQPSVNQMLEREMLYGNGSITINGEEIPVTEDLRLLLLSMTCVSRPESSDPQAPHTNLSEILRQNGEPLPNLLDNE